MKLLPKTYDNCVDPNCEAHARLTYKHTHESLLQPWYVRLGRFVRHPYLYVGLRGWRYP